MQQGLVDMVIVGADRVTRDGNVCNKIGTYLKALAAHAQGIPFYAAVPSPTIDWHTDAYHIEIETRAQEEVTQISGLSTNGNVVQVCLASQASPAFNPAFDVTPAKLVNGIITEMGIFTPDELGALQDA